MEVLVIGGTYFLGVFIVKKLIKRGYKVTILNRGNKKGLFGKNVSEIYLDRRNLSAFNETLSEKEFDVVIDLTAYLPKDTKAAIDIFSCKKIRHFLHCSTIAVYSANNKMPLTEESKREGNSKSCKNPFSSYGLNKSKCEDLLFNACKESSFPATILRPTYIYGPLDYTGRMSYFFKRITNNKPIYLPKENIKMQQIYANDVAEAFMLCINNKNAIGKAYNLCNQNCITFEELITQIGKTVGANPKLKYPPFYIPSPKSLPFAYFPFADWSFCCDASKSVKELKISYTPLEGGLEKTHRWLKQSNQL